MNKLSHRYLAVLALSLLLGEARADYWTVDELVEGFNQVSAQIARGELQAAEAGLDVLRQRTASNDVRIGQYQRELASAYLQQGRQQLQAGDKAGAGATLAKGERHLAATSPAFRQQYQAVVAEGGSAKPAAAPVVAAKPQPVAKPAEAKAPEERREDVERRLREAEATIARKEAERARQQQLAEEKAAAEREAAQRRLAAEQEATGLLTSARREAEQALAEAERERADPEDAEPAEADRHASRDGVLEGAQLARGRRAAAVLCRSGFVRHHVPPFVVPAIPPPGALRSL